MGTYKEVDGLRYTMEQLQNSGEKDQFPTGKGDLVASFKYIEDYMNQNCHPNTTLGAALHGDGLLTDHGVEHVKMVIQNAGKLVGDMQYKRLNGYEIYLLLLAIHFHDVGNVCGRQEHEKKIDDIITALGDRLPLDTPEKVMVSDIATAHGGYADIDHTDKDTLRHLSLIDNCNGIIIRPALLGAILRFADELSDDSTRANRYLNATGQIPSENMIFHAYSAALSPIAFNGNTIAFKYYIPFEQAKNRIPNDTGSFLYDEIIKRLSKCMQELEYCSKYSEGFIRISTLSVEIHKVIEKVDFDFSCRDIQKTVETLSSIISGAPNENYILVPLNTKLSTISTAIVALGNQKIQLCYAVPEVYNYGNYSTPDDKITAIDLKDFDVFHL